MTCKECGLKEHSSERLKCKHPSINPGSILCESIRDKAAHPELSYYGDPDVVVEFQEELT